jgi:hypothetical protein
MTPLPLSHSLHTWRSSSCMLEQKRLWSVLRTWFVRGLLFLVHVRLSWAGFCCLQCVSSAWLFNCYSCHHVFACQALQDGRMLSSKEFEAHVHQNWWSTHLLSSLQTEFHSAWKLVSPLSTKLATTNRQGCDLKATHDSKQVPLQLWILGTPKRQSSHHHFSSESWLS